MLHLLIVLAALTAQAWAQGSSTSSPSSGSPPVPIYSPARPPAVPLAVRSPYTSAWSSTSMNGTLNTNGVVYWPGTPLGWEGIVTVDGTSYEYLGTGSRALPALPNLKPAIPLSVSYDSQYSNFTFSAGPVEVTASFLSSVLPTDYCRSSIPLSYLTTSAQSKDNSSHDIQFYSDVNAAWVASENNVTTQWSFYQGAKSANGSSSTANSSGLYSWFVQLQEPYEFGEEFDVPLWGNFTYSTTPQGAEKFSFQSGFSGDLRFQHIMGSGLADNVDQRFRPFATQEPAFAYAHDFGSVSSTSVRYSIGSVQQPAIRYLTSSGVEPLQPWWTECYGDVFQMIDFHFNDFGQTQSLAARFETKLKADVDAYYNDNMAMIYSNATSVGPLPTYSNGSDMYSNGTDQYGDQYIFDPNNGYGFLNPLNFSNIPIPDVQEPQAYYSIVALSTRQIMGSYVFAVPPSSSSCSNSTSAHSADEPLLFQKEISSDGNVNTVDVLYPAMPFFLYANPSLLRFSLDPLFQNQEGGFYPNDYSMHDLGSHFPNATGHVEGDDEYMPVEESGNMILMSYAYYRFASSHSTPSPSDYLKSHYALLKQFASYLIEYSLLPGVQLSTDDFAGQLANQTNLAIKGIVGLEAMSRIATISGDASNAENYTRTAHEYLSQWMRLAIDPSGKHTMLAYQFRSSFSQLYNSFPDLLLGLDFLPQELYDMQSEFYPTVSQIFGTPLDSRHQYAKTDESLWTAATCAPETRRLFVNAIGYWLNETSTNLPFTDLYLTDGDGGYPVNDMSMPIRFIARPVVGGHFTLLSLLQRDRLADS